MVKYNLIIVYLTLLHTIYYDISHDCMSFKVSLHTLQHCLLVCQWGSPARRSSCCSGGHDQERSMPPPLHQPAWQRVHWQHLVAPPDGGDGRQAAERAQSPGMKSAGPAGECRLKTPRAEQEPDSPLMYAGLQEPGTLIQAGDHGSSQLGCSNTTVLLLIDGAAPVNIIYGRGSAALPGRVRPPSTP